MRKAQSSVEFLFTYGWAILAVSVSIGAIFYFNASNPDAFISQRCDLGSQFLCEEYTSFNNGTVLLLVRSLHQTPMNLNSANIVLDTTSLTVPVNQVLEPRDTVIISFNLPESLLLGRASITGLLRLDYSVPSSSNSYVVSGTITTGVIQ